MKLLLSIIILIFSLTCNGSNLKQIEKKYDLKIHTKLDNHYYGINRNENNFVVNFKQIKPEESKILLKIIDNCFKLYSREIIENCFDEIFLLHSINLNGEKQTVMKIANLLYIAADTSEEEISAQIHRNIAEIVFDKYHYLLSDKQFNMLNPSNFSYGNKIKKNDLLKNGFINQNATKSIKDDFINLSALLFTNSDSAFYFESKSLIIKQKLNLINNFYSNLKPSKTEIKNIQNTIYKLKKNYDISINYAYSVFHFPNTWLKNNYQPTGQQIEKENLEILLKYIDTFLAENQNSFEPYFLKKVVIIKNLIINNKPIDVISYNSTLFLSDNFLKQYSQEKYNDLIRNELFRLIYSNLYSYFPIEEWKKINQTAPDSAYLTDYGKQYFYYDFMDFYFAFLDENYPKNNSITNKKINLINKFHQTVSEEIQNLDLEKIRKYQNLLQKKYQVKIIDFNYDKYQNYVLPLTLVINDNINLLQLNRSLKVLSIFLDNIKQKGLNKYLNNIFIVENMEFLQGSDKVAGTFELTQKSIFIANIGNNKDFLLGTLFHEFSSLILYSSNKSFPKKEWITINGTNFNYKNLPENEKNIYEINEISNKEGFIDKYGTTCFENDYNEFAKLFFMDNNKLKNIANTYPKIKQKYILLKKFFETI